jgi:hypothetical protein
MARAERPHTVVPDPEHLELTMTDRRSITDTFILAFTGLFVIVTAALIGAFLLETYFAIGVALAILFALAIGAVVVVARVADDGADRRDRPTSA